MIDSIFIGTSGLQAFSEGLKVIGNNVANLNTPGYKANNSVFANLYFADPQGGSGQSTGGQTQFGSGVTLSQTAVNFRAGDLRQTGNPLDLNVSGEGFFVTRENGTADPIYTRAGQFEFDKDGRLVVRGTERQVIGLSATGEQLPITLDGLRLNPPTPTATVSLAGNLSSAATDFSVSSVKVIDANGGEHSLTLRFTPKTGAVGTWTVKLMDGTTEAGAGEIQPPQRHQHQRDQRLEQADLGDAPHVVPVVGEEVDDRGRQHHGAQPQEKPVEEAPPVGRARQRAARLQRRAQSLRRDATLLGPVEEARGQPVLAPDEVRVDLVVRARKVDDALGEELLVHRPLPPERRVGLDLAGRRDRVAAARRAHVGARGRVPSRRWLG